MVSKDALEEFFEGKNIKLKAIYIRNLSFLFMSTKNFFLYYTVTLDSKQIRFAVHNHIVQTNKNNHPPHVTPKKLYDANLSPQKKLI